MRRRFREGCGEVGEGNTTTHIVGTEQTSQESHSQQDEIHDPTFSSLPPRSIQEARAQRGGVPGRDPYAFMEQA